MKEFFEKPYEKLMDIPKMGRDALIYRYLPNFLLEILSNYFRLEVEGLENIPRRGRVLITPNHSGFTGFDALVLAHEIVKGTKRIPRVLTHHLWFLTKTTAIPANKLGLIEATRKNGVSHLKKNHVVVLFPEGEYGNFKPSSKKYILQEFKRGFVRMALETKSPIVPTVILGAEETNINLRTLKFAKYLRGPILPLPLNILPLPARWKVIFMEPIYLPYKPAAANDTDLVHEIASDIREQIQRRVNQELRERKSIYF